MLILELLKYYILTNYIKLIFINLSNVNSDIVCYLWI